MFLWNARIFACQYDVISQKNLICFVTVVWSFLCQNICTINRHKKVIFIFPNYFFVTCNRAHPKMLWNLLSTYTSVVMIVKGMFKFCGGLGCDLNSHSLTYYNYTFWDEEWILPSPFFVRCFSGAFLKFRKASVSFVLSVPPSAWNNSALTERIFKKFSIWIFFQNLPRKFKFHSNLAEKWVLYMKTNIHFCSYLAHFFLEWEILCSVTFFWQSLHSWNNVEKYCRAQQASQISDDELENVCVTRADHLIPRLIFLWVKE